MSELAFENLTPIQEQSLPTLLEGKDIIGQSKTGSGKTLAYAVPLLNKIELKQKTLQALVLCPTRELAIQVVGEFRKLGRRLEGLQVTSLVGGQPGREQAIALKNGAHIAVGTPGRVLDLLERRRMDTMDLESLVLDEADKMLDMGFLPEIDAIISRLPENRQTLFFSATFPTAIEDLSQKYQKEPTKFVIEEGENELANIDQFFYKCDTNLKEKPNFLLRALLQHPAPATLVFCNTKAAVAELVALLESKGASAASLSGDMEQRDRDRTLTLFRNGSIRVLVATDVAARGLDIENLEVVINYDLPPQVETYVHRMGRTGRAGKSGVAICIGTATQESQILEYERHLGIKFHRNVLGFKNQHGLSKDLATSAMQTLLILAGRKEKLRPGDFLGALTAQGKGLSASEVGKIDVTDRSTYVAVAVNRAEEALELLKTKGIKGKKFQIRLQN